MKPSKRLINEIVAITEQAMPLPASYPQIGETGTVADLEMLADYFNKRYFGGIIKKVRVKFAPLAKNFFGKAHVEYGAEYEIKDMLITIATMCQKDPKNLVDTMAHEMIHAWQYTMNEKDKTGKYCEVTWAEIFSSRDKHTHGHNNYFHDWAEKMNKDGFNISVESGLDTEISLVKEFYGIAVTIGTEAALLVYSDKDPSKNLPEILASIAERVGTGSFSDYTLFKTNDAGILMGTRLTKSWVLPKNVLNIRFKPERVGLILDSKLTSIIITDQVSKVSGDKLDLVDNKGISPALVQMVAAIAKYRNSDFDSFLKTAFYNAYPEWNKIAGNILYSKKREYKDVKIPDDFKEEEAEYVWKNWLKISDIEIKRSTAIKYFCSAMKRAVVYKKIEVREMQDFNKKYEKDFSVRVAKDKFIQLAFDFCWSEVQKEMKKSVTGQTISKSDYIRVFQELLKDTDLKDLAAKIK